MKFNHFIIILSGFLFLSLNCNKDNNHYELTKKTGLLLTPSSVLSKVDEALPPILEKGTVPPRADISANMPPPGDQGYQNSCVGFVVAYALKTYQEKVEQKWEIVQTNGSIQRNKVFSPSYIYNQINNGTDRGSHYHDAFNLLSRYGCASLETFPYDQDDYTRQPDRSADNEAEQFRITWSKTISPNNLKTIKSYLSEGVPVMIGLGIDEEFTEDKGPVLVDDMGDQGDLGHAMIIVGYDDNKEAFRLMNSWGTGWRDGGYCWMTYSLFRRVVNEAWITKDMESDRPIKKDEVVQVDNSNPVVDHLKTDLALTNVTYDVKDPDNPELGPAVKITGEVNLDNAFGNYAQIVVYLSYENGDPVETDNYEYATVDGQAIGLTPEYNLTSIITKHRPFTIYIPYSVLELKRKAGGIKIIAKPVLFVDNYDASRGESLILKIK